MHTLVTLSGGVLRTKLFIDEGLAVDKERWRTALRPAIMFLREAGGGRFLVVHRQRELV